MRLQGDLTAQGKFVDRYKFLVIISSYDFSAIVVFKIQSFLHG